RRRVRGEQGRPRRGRDHRPRAEEHDRAQPPGAAGPPVAAADRAHGRRPEPRRRGGSAGARRAPGVAGVRRRAGESPADPGAHRGGSDRPPRAAQQAGRPRRRRGPRDADQAGGRPRAGSVHGGGRVDPHAAALTSTTAALPGVPSASGRAVVAKSGRKGWVTARDLLDLHVPGRPLVLPNIWDADTARLVVEAGFPAVATSSVAVAATLGYSDGEEATAAEMFAAAGRIVAAVDVPVTVDAESG